MFNRDQIIAICGATSVLLMVLLFPPFVLEGDNTRMGYHFLLSAPQQDAQIAVVDTTTLVTEWLAVMLYAGLAFILTQDTPLLFGQPAAPRPVTKINERLNPIPAYPWIRFCARTVDYGLFLSVFYGLVFTLRAIDIEIRFSDSILIDSVVWSMIANVPLVLYEATCLSTFATTPGKALFAIRVLTKDGTILSFHQALMRSFAVLVHGFTFLILFPIIPILSLSSSYKEVKATGIAYWDKKYRYQLARGPLTEAQIFGFSVLGLIAAVAISLPPILMQKSSGQAVVNTTPILQANVQPLPKPVAPTPLTVDKNTSKKLPKETLTPPAPKKVVVNPAPVIINPPPPPSTIIKKIQPPAPVMLEEDIPPPKVTKKVIREYRNILEAIKAKDMAALEDYFRQGGSLNARIEGTTLLITAVKTGNVEMVKWLIENGANTEKTDSDGRSPYLYAQIANNEVILSLIGDNAASSGSEISHWQHQGDNWSRGR